MAITDWFFFISICFFGALSPGPSFLIIIHNTLTNGLKAGYKSSFGHAFGIFLYSLIACFVLVFVINFDDNFFNFLRILGAVYLVYVAIKIVKRKTSNVNINDFSKNENFYLSGFYISFLNPKIAIFFISLFSQFVYVNNKFYLYIIMAFIASFVDFLVYSLYVNLVLKLNFEKFFKKNEYVITLIFSIILIVFSIIIFLEIFNLI